MAWTTWEEDDRAIRVLSLDKGAELLFRQAESVTDKVLALP
jgi:hypothetical protein